MKLTEGPLPDDLDAPLQQHPAFARALEACGQTVRSFRPGKDGAAQVICRRASAFVSRGPILDSDDRQDALVALRRALPQFALITNAETACGFAETGHLQIMTPAHVAQLDLRGSTADRRGRLKQKWRNRLVAAESDAIKTRVEPFDPAKHRWLLDLDAAQQRQRGYRAWPGSVTVAFAHKNPGDAQVFTATLKGQPIAAILILRHGPRATYHIGHTTPLGRLHNAHTLLIWQAIEWLAAQAHTLFDLGIIDTETTPGLARFKLGTGAAAKELGGTWLHSPLTAWLSTAASTRSKIPMRGPAPYQRRQKS
ncbi:GNAT family N-acetyltransferase [Pseudaestuariivita rosea]|uniref:GNAT family N-acetyltransferase n=1 Tax=Pseudaestuariivita rosea TaxID=2763263 RepID=UPI001ABA50DC|nr:GNAT family N-acetyltransferase [Pseudaestuariivita rosea]